MKADEVGLHLQLLPVLLGFFTYKGAVIARGALDLFAGLSASPAVQPLTQQSADEASAVTVERRDITPDAVEALEPSTASSNS